MAAEGGLNYEYLINCPIPELIDIQNAVKKVQARREQELNRIK